MIHSFVETLRKTGTKSRRSYLLSPSPGPMRSCRPSAPNTHQILLCGPSEPRIYGLLRPAPAPRALAGSAALVKQEKPLPQNVTTALLNNNRSVSDPAEHQCLLLLQIMYENARFEFFPLQKHMYSLLFWSEKKKRESDQDFPYFSSKERNDFSKTNPVLKSAEGRQYLTF